MQVSQQRIGQMVWVDSISRIVLADGTLLQRIENRAVTGARITPYSICKALEESDVYDGAISAKLREGLSGDSLLSSLILDDVRRTADLLRYIFDRSDGVDGWVIVPVSPLKTTDYDVLKEAVITLHDRLQRPNVLISVPGFKEMSDLLEDLVFLGIPINISLICSQEQYVNTAEVYLRGVERRMKKGLNPVVPVFTSVSISALATEFMTDLSRDEVIQTSVAMARKIYKSMRILHTSRKWERAYNGGARFLKIIWDICADEKPVDYWATISRHLIAPFTISSIPEIHLEEFIKDTQETEPMPENDHECDRILTAIHRRGHHLENVAESLQKNLAESQVKMWITLLDMLARKSVSIIGKC